MKVGIATVQVPFMYGGAEIHADSLKQALLERGYEADIISIPFKWYPPQTILDNIMAARLLDLTGVNGNPIDRLITLKFPMYYVDHPNKVGWILHQHRQAYDLYDTSFGDLRPTEAGRAVCREIHRLDNLKLPEHKKLFTNARNTAERLMHYNGIEAEPLYHPPQDYDRFYCSDYEPFVLVPGRLDGLKRQQLLVEALSLLPGELKAIIIGPANSAYGDQLREQVKRLGLEKRVEIRGLVSREEKLELYARALAVYNGVLDEDYGYITLEGFFASKPVITHTDSGGPLEFVGDRQNGFITRPEPQAIAEVLAELQQHAGLAEQLGRAGRATVERLNLNWDYVIERLLQEY